MTHKIKSVQPLDDCILMVDFFNGIVKTYDIKALYSIFPQFKIFEVDKNLFKCVIVDTGGYGISWNDELDLDAEDIWENGIEVERKEVDIITELAENLIKAREINNITQKQLAEITGINQSDISRLERGLSNPSISTLERLSKGLNMDLHITFKTSTEKENNI